MDFAPVGCTTLATQTAASLFAQFSFLVDGSRSLPCALEACALAVAGILWRRRNASADESRRLLSNGSIAIACLLLSRLTLWCTLGPLFEAALEILCLAALCMVCFNVSRILLAKPNVEHHANATIEPTTGASATDKDAKSPAPLKDASRTTTVNVTPEVHFPAPQKEDWLRPLIECLPHPVWVFDAESQFFVAVNRSVRNRYGYSDQDFTSMSVRDVVDAEDVNRVLQSGAGGAEQDAVYSWRHRTKAGVLRNLGVVSSSLSLSGRSLRVVIAADVRNRSEQEGAIREREELFRNVIAHIPCGVFWKDRASVYLGCNDQVARDHRLTVRGEVVGLTDHELAVVPEEADLSRKSDRRVLETREPLLNVEEAHTRRDGGKAALLVSRVPLRDAAGETVGVLGVYQDVTDRKRLEEQLRQAQKMEAIGRLAGGIAHDFNNLLTIIFGNAHLLRQLPADSPDFPQLIDDIHDAADRAAALTRQLLTFSRRQPSRPEVIDLNEVVAGLGGLLRRLLGERISVRAQVASESIRVRADRGQIEQVVMNLAVNARDAMPGGGTLTIVTSSVTLTAGPGNTATRLARLTVSDTGVGMTDEVKARIFEPFFTTKDPGKGTGLGLATVYGIVEQAGGSIEVESAPGAGSTFRIGLPWCDALPRPSAITSSRCPHATGMSGGGRTVLLTEDEDGIRKLARYTLESDGYTVIEAENAESAIPLLRSDRPIDLLVTDLVMPGMDGRELASQVRIAHPDVAVVFISGYVPDAHRLEGLPGALFLPKPFNPADLVKIAERAVRRNCSGRETMMSATAGEQSTRGD
jgi:PAS domain S-box-containing protein